MRTTRRPPKHACGAECRALQERSKHPGRQPVMRAPLAPIAVGPASARSARLRRAARQRPTWPSGAASRTVVASARRARADMLDDVMRIAINLGPSRRDLDLLCQVHAILAEAEDAATLASGLAALRQAFPDGRAIGPASAKRARRAR